MRIAANHVPCAFCGLSERDGPAALEGKHRTYYVTRHVIVAYSDLTDKKVPICISCWANDKLDGARAAII